MSVEEWKEWEFPSIYCVTRLLAEDSEARNKSK
jgi:hypothetical protein